VAQCEIEIGMRKDGSEESFLSRTMEWGLTMNHADRLFGVFQRLHPEEEI